MGVVNILGVSYEVVQCRGTRNRRHGGAAARRQRRLAPGDGRRLPAWDAALNSGDAKPIAAFYTDDAVFLPATHDVIEGPAGEEVLGGLLGGGLTGHKLELIEVEGDEGE